MTGTRLRWKLFEGVRSRSAHLAAKQWGGVFCPLKAVRGFCWVGWWSNDGNDDRHSDGRESCQNLKHAIRVVANMFRTTQLDQSLSRPTHHNQLAINIVMVDAVGWSVG